MGLTDEQNAIIQASFPGKSSTSCVQAYAGTGKTHTLLEFAANRSDYPILYLAFNKSMASEAQRKFEGHRHVQAQTLHSLAYRFIGYRCKNRLGDIHIRSLLTTAQSAFPKSHQYGSAVILKTWFDLWLSSADSTPRAFIEKALDAGLSKTLAKARMDEGRLVREVETLWDHVLKGNQLGGSPCPFPHNAYLKLLQLNPPNLGYSYILIDEAQDITDCMIDLVMSQAGHKIFVGDSYQQIYAWNGAVNSLKKLEKDGAAMFYLTHSFRCPIEVAHIADAYLQLLGAPKPFHGCNVPRRGATDRAFLARTNAGVFEAGVKTLEGKPQAKIHFLGGYDSYNFDILLDMASLLQDKRHQIKDATLLEYGSFEALEEYAAAADMQLNARCKIVRRHGASVSPKLFSLRSRQSPVNIANITLATGHKSKGAEWAQVVLGDDFIDIGHIVGAVEEATESVSISREELHVLYVAITRALVSLKMTKDYTLTPQVITRFKQLCQSGKIILAG